MTQTNSAAYKAAEYTAALSLINSVLRGTAPNSSLFSDVNWHRLLSLCEKHSIAGMTYYGVEALAQKPPREIEERWRELRDKGIVKDINQQTELELITQQLSQCGIRFVLLKGFALKRLYPQSDMRTMSDLDILIDAENAAAANSVMTELEYACTEYGRGAHDVYTKPPHMLAEFHRSMFEYEGREFIPMFSHPWENVDSSDGAAVFLPQYCMKYLIAHAVKHCTQGGTGIRTVLDLWLYRRQYKDSLDMREIFAEFDAVGHGRLCRGLIALGDKWFADCGSPEADEIEAFILGSGTYGTYANKADMDIQRVGRAGYIGRLLFPEYAKMKNQYPILKKAPALLPAVWLWRIAVMPIKNFRQNREKLKAIMKSQKGKNT